MFTFIIANTSVVVECDDLVWDAKCVLSEIATPEAVTGQLREEGSWSGVHLGWDWNPSENTAYRVWKKSQNAEVKQPSEKNAISNSHSDKIFDLWQVKNFEAFWLFVFSHWVLISCKMFAIIFPDRFWVHVYFEVNIETEALAVARYIGFTI